MKTLEHNKVLGNSTAKNKIYVGVSPNCTNWNDDLQQFYGNHYKEFNLFISYNTQHELVKIVEDYFEIFEKYRHLFCYWDWNFMSDDDSVSEYYEELFMNKL